MPRIGRGQLRLLTRHSLRGDFSRSGEASCDWYAARPGNFHSCGLTTPEVAIISRDQSYAYPQRAREGVPETLQIADDSIFSRTSTMAWSACSCANSLRAYWQPHPAHDSAFPQLPPATLTNLRYGSRKKSYNSVIAAEHVTWKCTPCRISLAHP